ncbi:MAG: MFS transporter [Novosphingobium sp.]
MAIAAPIDDTPGPARATAYGWAVFALSFGLLMSDYMARQVLNAVNPLLKVEWSLSDAELASLSSVVSLAVGLLTLPLSLAADRFGRVRSLTAMALLWSFATLGGAMAQSYGQMLGARLLVGVGEAAYGSVGIALVLSVFPVTMRATLSSAFLAGTIIGQVAGVAIGGTVAASHGWRASFEAIGLFGLVLALAYPLVVREARIGLIPPREKLDLARLARQLLGRRELQLTYLGSGIQCFCTGTMAVFLPSLFNRYYGMAVGKAGATTALYLLICAAGMIGCGIAGDRLARRDPNKLPLLAASYALASALLFALTFMIAPGNAQLVLLGGALLIMAGVPGIAGAIVANQTPRPIHGTAMATLALGNNLVGLAPGPLIIGWLADRMTLITALKFLPVPALLSALAFLAVRRALATNEISAPTERAV